MWSWIILLLSIMLSVLYLYLILRFYFAFRKMPIAQSSIATEEKVSVVVAVRNEEANMTALLEALYKQKIEKEAFEVIVVDDHSEDQSAALIRSFQNLHPDFKLRYYAQKKGEWGKKAALRLALAKVKYPIIMQTDGDCLPTEHWISIGRSYFAQPQIQLLLGAVKISNCCKVREGFQAIELMSLMGSTAGAVGIKKPLMSNGSNIAFRKTALAKLSVDFYDSRHSSGDDMFLMFNLLKTFGVKSIAYAKHPEHIVQTAPELSWRALWQQRLRWVSKSGSYRNPFVIGVSLLVLLQNLWWICLPWLLYIIHEFWVAFGCIAAAKVLVDALLIRQQCYFYKVPKLMRYYPFSVLLYPFFTVGAAILGLFMPFKWKGRRIAN